MEFCFEPLAHVWVIFECFAVTVLSAVVEASARLFPVLSVSSCSPTKPGNAFHTLQSLVTLILSSQIIGTQNYLPKLHEEQHTAAVACTCFVLAQCAHIQPYLTNSLWIIFAIILFLAPPVLCRTTWICSMWHVRQWTVENSLLYNTVLSLNILVVRYPQTLKYCTTSGCFIVSKMLLNMSHIEI